jgi:hypothetical protein
MNYGQAFVLAKGGDKIAREAWSSNTYVTFKDGNVEFNTRPQLLITEGNNTRAWVAYPDDTEALDWIVWVMQ